MVQQIKNLETNKLTNREKGFLVGLALGDASIEKERRVNFAFSNKEKDLAQYTLSLLKKGFYHKTSYTGKIVERKNNILIIQDNPFLYFLKKYDITNTLNKQAISNKIKEESKEFKYGFVSGFYSADGNICTKSRLIRISQSDNNLIKRKNKMKCLLFIKTIMDSVHIKNVFSPYKIPGRYGVGFESGFRLYTQINKNNKYSTIFKKYFHLHNKEKEKRLEKLIEYENIPRKKNYHRRFTADEVRYIRTISKELFLEKFSSSHEDTFYNIKNKRFYKGVI